MEFDNDLFDGYVRDELSPEQRARLDARLTEDRARGGTLAREWDAHVAAYEALAQAEVITRVARARQRYRDAPAANDSPAAHEPAAPPTPARREAAVRPLWRRSWAVAAAVALLALVGGRLLLGEAEPQRPEVLATNYFEPAIGLPTLLGPAEDIRFESGMVDYKLGDFDAAIATWAPLVGEDIDQDTLAFYLGVAELGAGRAEAALEQLARVDVAALTEKRDWYRALALLRLDRAAEAESLLAGIAAAAGPRAADAEALLEEL